MKLFLFVLFLAIAGQVHGYEQQEPSSVEYYGFSNQVTQHVLNQIEFEHCMCHSGVFTNEMTIADIEAAELTCLSEIPSDEGVQSQMQYYGYGLSGGYMDPMMLSHMPSFYNCQVGMICDESQPKATKEDAQGLCDSGTWSTATSYNHIVSRRLILEPCVLGIREGEYFVCHPFDYMDLSTIDVNSAIREYRDNPSYALPDLELADMSAESLAANDAAWEQYKVDQYGEDWSIHDGGFQSTRDGTVAIVQGNYTGYGSWAPNTPDNPLALPNGVSLLWLGSPLNPICLYFTQGAFWRRICVQSDGTYDLVFQTTIDQVVTFNNLVAGDTLTIEDAISPVELVIGSLRCRRRRRQQTTTTTTPPSNCGGGCGAPHRGECVDDGLGGRVCDCRHPFTGLRCDDIETDCP